MTKNRSLTKGAGMPMTHHHGLKNKDKLSPEQKINTFPRDSPRKIMTYELPPALHSPHATHAEPESLTSSTPVVVASGLLVGPVLLPPPPLLLSQGRSLLLPPSLHVSSHNTLAPLLLLPLLVIATAAAGQLLAYILEGWRRKRGDT